MVSMGSLSGLVFQFHIGKPLTSFFIISVLWAASFAGRASRQNTPTGRVELPRDWRIALFFVYFTACLFLDETALFAYMVLAVMLFEDFRDRLLPPADAGPVLHARLLTALIAAGPLVVFTIATFVVVPWISRLIGATPFNFLAFVLGYEHKPLGSGFHLANFYQ